MGILDEFFVSIGVKGQNVVLSEINKVKKQAGSLNKVKSTINMSKGNIPKILPSAKISPNKIKNSIESIKNQTVLSQTEKPESFIQSKSENKPEQIIKNQTSEINKNNNIPESKFDNKKADNLKKESENLNKFKTNLEKEKTNLVKSSGKIISNKTKPFVGMVKNKVAETLIKINGQPLLNKMVSPECQPRQNPEQQKTEKNQKENNNKFANGANKFANGVTSFSQSAATFDPISVIKNTTSGFGTALSGITVLGESLGQLPKGIADVSNSLVEMASGALTLAKQSASEQYGLSTRNATTEYYNGNEIKQQGMSHAEHAQLVMEIAGQYGKIQKPLQDILNKLIETKDTAALGRVASGNIESIGTDKAYYMQKIENSLGDLPPSIRQKFHAQLLSKMAPDIQDKTKNQAFAQSITAGYINRKEEQTGKVFEKTSSDEKAAKFKTMDIDKNSMQMQLIETGVMFSVEIGKMIKVLKELPEAIENLKNKINKIQDTLHIPQDYRVRFDK